MNITKFVRQNRQRIDEITQSPYKNDDERRLWVLNDEYLYTCCRRGLEISAYFYGMRRESQTRKKPFKGEGAKMKQEKSEYDKQAEDFLKKTNTSFKAVFDRHGNYFDNDKEGRDIYMIELRRGDRFFIFSFGQSILNSCFKVFRKDGKEMNTFDLDKSDHKRFLRDAMVRFGTLQGLKINKEPVPPSAYDVLSCLQKYDVGTFVDFCSEFGYDEDSRTAEKTYKAVREEWLNVQKLWTDEEIRELQDIQ